MLTLILSVVGALLTGAELLIGRELVNLLVDVLYGLVDPRVRYG